MAQSETNSLGRPRRGRAWTLLLVLPYIGLCFPGMYVRLTPALWGFPFFYWYQFGWVLLTSAMLWFVYKMQKQSVGREADFPPGMTNKAAANKPAADEALKEANGTL